MHDLFEEGYIVFPRSVDPAIFNNEKWFKVWWWCLMESNFQDNIVPVNTGRGTTSMMVKRGQFVFGRNKHSKALNMAPSTLWKIILGFEKREILNIESNNHNSLITFCNYDAIVDPNNYQGTAKGTGKEQASDRQVTGKEHNINKETNVTKEKKGTNKRVFVENSDEYRLSKLLSDLMLGNNPENQISVRAKNNDYQSWAEEIRKMNQLDKRSFEQIEYLINWSQQDDFWSGNILSTKKLKSQYDTLVLRIKEQKGKKDQLNKKQEEPFVSSYDRMKAKLSNKQQPKDITPQPKEINYGT